MCSTFKVILQYLLVTLSFDASSSNERCSVQCRGLKISYRTTKASAVRCGRAPSWLYCSKVILQCLFLTWSCDGTHHEVNSIMHFAFMTYQIVTHGGCFENIKIITHLLSSCPTQRRVEGRVGIMKVLFFFIKIHFCQILLYI